MNKQVYQSEKLYVKENGLFRWVKTERIFNKMGLDWSWKDRKFVSQEEIQSKLGKPIIEWPEKEEPEPTVEPRHMAVLGTCLPGCESMWKDLGGTHFYGNRLGWPNYDECERLGLKVFVNVRDDDAMPSDKFIRDTVNEYKDRPVCGGYWSDSVGGHEPDITNQPPSDIQRWLDQRKRFYDIVRSIDPDVINHPVMEMFDCTLYQDFADHPYPGWELAYSDETHDLLIVDIYCYGETDEAMRNEIITLFGKLVRPYAHTHQVVPQINAISYRTGSIWCAYDTWKSLLSGKGFDNPYRSSRVSLAYYKDECVRKNGEMQVEIKAVNKEIMNV